MRRVVKAWAVWENGRGISIVYRSREAAQRDSTVYQGCGHALPCTITYDDGKKPRKKATR